MNFCTCFSKTHQIFFEKYFLKTFPFSANVSLVAEIVPQACKSGYLFASGWRDQMIYKQEFISKCLNRFKGELCVFCDADIRFYSEHKDIGSDLFSCLGNKDICFLKDHADSVNGRGAGFFVLRSTPKTIDFFSGVLARLRKLSVERKGRGVTFDTSEQGTINDMLFQRKDIDWGFLPERYYTHGKYINGVKNPTKPNGCWWDQKDAEEKRNIFIPFPLSVHHANWCTGIENKMHLLDFVASRVQGRKSSR